MAVIAVMAVVCMADTRRQRNENTTIDDEACLLPNWLPMNDVSETGPYPAGNTLRVGFLSRL